ncbi:kinase-like domain-containing protein [Xylaria sp. FL0064]|nr:kinase-like domain-containing protein [Xylaria sp. FL0064]
MSPASFQEMLDTASIPSIPGHVCDGIHIGAYGKDIHTIMNSFTLSADGTLLNAGAHNGTRPHNPTSGELQDEDVDWTRLDLSSIPAQEFPPRMLIMSRKSCPVSPTQEISSIGNWLEVDMVNVSDAGQPVRLYAIGPRMEQASFRITHNETCCDMLFDLADDRLIIVNNSPNTVMCQKIYEDNVLVKIEKDASAVLTAGEWMFAAYPDGLLMEFKLLGRMPPHVSQQPSTKRSAGSDLTSVKKSRLAANLSLTRLTTALQGGSSGNPFLALERGDVIFKAEHSKIPGKLVVVKVIKPNSRHRVATVNSVKDWINEMFIHSSLKPHYAIVPYLGCDAQYNSIITEYVDAKPLVYHVKDVRAWMVLSDMAMARSFLHANGIAHGDIKLGNILFDPVRGAVLIDFNLSFGEGGLAIGEGSPWYLPPEFVEDKDARRPASDMWALGVVMLWLLHKIPMPESTSPWTVEDIHPRGSTTLAVHKKAHGKMEDWIALVQTGNGELREEEEMADIVNGPVQQEKDNRTNSATLVE